MQTHAEQPYSNDASLSPKTRTRSSFDGVQQVWIKRMPVIEKNRVQAAIYPFMDGVRFSRVSHSSFASLRSNTLVVAAKERPQPLFTRPSKSLVPLLVPFKERGEWHSIEGIKLGQVRAA